MAADKQIPSAPDVRGRNTAPEELVSEIGNRSTEGCAACPRRKFSLMGLGKRHWSSLVRDTFA